MPQQDTAVLGYNLTEFKRQTDQVIEYYNAVIAAIAETEKAARNFSNFSAGVKDFKASTASAKQAQDDLRASTDSLNKSLNETAKLREANAKASKAQTAADRETVKLIADEAKAEREELKTKQAKNKELEKELALKKQNADVPFTTNLNADGSVNEPPQGNTSGTVVSNAEIAATQEQLAVEKELNAERKKSKSVLSEQALAIQTETTNIERLSIALLEDKAALASNLAAQKEITGTTEADIKAKAQLVAEQFALKESISATTIELKNATKEFLSQEGSIDQLRALVNNLRLSYDSLSEAERNTTGGQAQLAEIERLDTAVKELEADTGRFQKNVGNYPKGSYNGLKQELQALEKEYNNLTAAEIKSQKGVANLSAQSAIKTELKSIENAAVGSAGAIAKVGSEAFGFLKQAAYLIPGLGIAGIIGAITDALTSLISNFLSQSNAAKQATTDLENYTNEVDNAKNSLADLNSELQFIGKLFTANTNLRFGQNLSTDVDAANTQLGVLIQEYYNLDNVVGKAAEKAEKAKIQYSSIVAAYGEDNAITKDALQQLNKIIETRDSLLDQQLNKQKEIDLQRIVIAQAEKNRDEDLTKKAKEEADKRLKIAQENYKALLRAQIEAQQTIVENSNPNDYAAYTQRYEAVKKISRLEKQLSDFSLQIEVENGKSRIVAAQEASNKLVEIAKKEKDNLQKIQIDKKKFSDNLPILTPKEYYDEELKKLEDLHTKQLISDHDYYEKKQKLEKDAFKNLSSEDQVALQLAKQKEVNDKLIAASEKFQDQRSAQIASQLSQENTEINNQYAHGLISKEEYEKEKIEIARKYGKEALEVAIDLKEKELLVAQQGNASQNVIDKLQQEIIKLKEALSDLGVEFKDNPIDKTSQQFKDLITTLQTVAEITNTLGDAFTGLAEVSLDNAKTQLEELGAQQDKNYEKEVENINNSSLSQEEKANRLKVLDSQHQAQQEEIERKQREYDNKKAEFDRDANITKIITGTLAAAASAGFVTPLGIAIEIAGALALVKALATKIPHYKFGLDKDISTHIGLYGEAGPELVEKPGIQPFIASNPTIDIIPFGSRITPLDDDEVNKLLYNSMIKNTGKIFMMPSKKTDADIEKIMEKHANKIIAGMNRQKPYFRQQDVQTIAGQLMLKKMLDDWKNMK